MAASRYLPVTAVGNGKWALVSKTNERSRASLEGMNLPCMQCPADRDPHGPSRRSHRDLPAIGITKEATSSSERAGEHRTQQPSVNRHPAPRSGAPSFFPSGAATTANLTPTRRQHSDEHAPQNTDDRRG